MRGLTKSVLELAKPVNGCPWLTAAIETTCRKQFISDNAVLLATLAGNVVACGISESEAMKAAVSQIVAARALGCRASAITPAFRTWTKAEKMKAVAARNAGIRPKEVLERPGRVSVTEMADRKKIYTAQVSDSIGRRWAKEAASLPVYLSAAIQFWTTSPDPRIPPLCLLSDGAIAKIFLRDATIEEESMRQAIHRLGLLRPTEKRFSFNGRKFSARTRF